MQALAAALLHAPYDRYSFQEIERSGVPDEQI
jgi:hypothetical protein